MPSAGTFQRFRVKKEVRSPYHFSNVPDDGSSVTSSSSSCIQCRRRKKKCSREVLGCSSCSLLGEVCSYPSRSKSSTVNTLLERIAWLEKIVDSAIPNGHPSIETVKTGQEFIIPKKTNGKQEPRQEVVMMGLMPLVAESQEDDGSFEVGRDTIIELVKAYMNNMHKCYPFMDKILLQELFDNPDWSSYPPEAMCLIHLMAANGCYCRHNKSGGDPAEKNLPRKLAMRGLSQGLKNLSFNDFESVKFLVLLALYSFFEPVNLSSWMIVGTATRLAISLGLNRKACLLKNGEVYCPRKTEHRHRLFWSVYILDRQISVATGRPTAIVDEDVDVPMPALTGAERESADHISHHFDLEISSLLISMSIIEGDILKTINGRKFYQSSPEVRHQTVADFRNTINDWYDRACKVSTSCALEFGSIRSPYESQIWLSLRYTQMLILLYGPLVTTRPPQDSQVFTAIISPKSPSSLDEEHYAPELRTASRQVVKLTTGLFKDNMLEMNWITLYRFLSTCKAIIHGVSKNLLNSIDASSDLSLCATVLESFGSQWSVARQSAMVFKSISKHTLFSEGGGETDVETLLCDILGSASSFVNGADSRENADPSLLSQHKENHFFWPEIGNWFDEQLNRFNENFTECLASI